MKLKLLLLACLLAFAGSDAFAQRISVQDGSENVVYHDNTGFAGQDIGDTDLSAARSQTATRVIVEDITLMGEEGLTTIKVYDRRVYDTTPSESDQIEDALLKRANPPNYFQAPGNADPEDIDGPDPELEESNGVWDFILKNWGELLIYLLGFGEIVVRLTPTTRDDAWFAWIKRLVDGVIPNLKRGGGRFTSASD